MAKRKDRKPAPKPSFKEVERTIRVFDKKTGAIVEETRTVKVAEGHHRGNIFM